LLYYINMDSRVYELYKPLRNHLRKLKLDDSLYVIWSYIQHLQFRGFSIPTNEIEVIPKFLNADYIQKLRWCSPWEIETLTREIILNSSEFSSDKTIAKWNYFANTINKLKELENKISGLYINQDNILIELFRIAHRQFLWQTGPSNKFLVRYYKIFSSPDLNKIIEKTVGLSVKSLYSVGMMFIGAYLKSPAINMPINIEVQGINRDNIENFLECFSSTIKDLKKKLNHEQEMNSKFAYSFSSLRAYPIIKMQYHGKKSLVCPLPTLLFWRITSGVYYEVCDKQYFDNSFGASFQKYVGDVIKISLRESPTIKVLSEEQYSVGKDRKDTADWIIYDNNSILFIECKTKRLRLPAKFELDDSSYANKELEKMADFILQIYKSIEDYRKNKYPSLKYSESKRVYPLVLTLENWHVIGDCLLSELENMVVKRLNKDNIDTSCLKEMPYSICSVDEFENLVQLIPITGIDLFMHNKVFDSEMNKCDFHSYMNSKYAKEYKNNRFLFEEDCNNIFESLIK